MPGNDVVSGHGEPHGSDEHDLGLAHDLAVLTGASGSAPAVEGKRVDRRRALGLVGGGAAAALVLAACRVPTTGGGYAATPPEIAGPFPADGSNGPNVLPLGGIVRRDIRPSFGTASGDATGVPLTVQMRITDVSNHNLVRPGAAVYVWHCDQLGRYSLYSPGVTDQNYLRGVQVADAGGLVTFITTFPGCYPGRWPHIHFEVYPDLAHAQVADSLLLTSQLALPQAACAAVYATAGYTGAASNLAGIPIENDLVFRDGWSHEMAAVTGDAQHGFRGSLVVAVP